MPLRLCSSASRNKSGSKDVDDKKKKKGKSKSKESSATPDEVSQVEIPEGPFTDLNAHEVSLIASFMTHPMLFRSMRVSKKWLEAIRSIKLDTLDLRSFYGTLADEHVIAILTKHPSMHTVRLHAAPLVTEKSMKHMGKLPQLRTLDLTNCRNLSDGALSKIPTERLQHLTSLTISHCSFSERSLKLGPLPNLTTLDISSCDGLTNRVGALIPQMMPALTYLDASSSPTLSNEFLGHLSKVSSLTWLSLRNSHGYDHHGFAQLCGEPPKSAAAQAAVAAAMAANPHLAEAKLPLLKTLDLSSTWVNSESLVRVCKAFPTLTDLSVSFCNRIDDEGTASLQNLTQLLHLSISYTDITTKSLKKIAALPALQTLTIAGCRAVKPFLKDFKRRFTHIAVYHKSTTSAPLKIPGQTR